MLAKAPSRQPVRRPIFRADIPASAPSRQPRAEALHAPPAPGSSRPDLGKDQTMPRLFTALEIPRDAALSLSLLRGGLPGARWIDPENYHLTLRFYGDVQGHVADQIAVALDRVRRPSFTLALSGVGAFGSKKPHSIYAGVAPSPELNALQAEIERIGQRLGLPADATMTSTGGLSFFGAPLNNYMTHAAAGIVRRLRGHSDALGLLYGQGEYVTKHHAIVLATRPPEQAPSESYRVDQQADLHSGVVPRLLSEYAGAATLETFTVVYGREGEPEFGTVIARTPAGDRLMARVPASDTATLAALTDLDARPVGNAGTVTAGDEGRLHWRAA